VPAVLPFSILVSAIAIVGVFAGVYLSAVRTVARALVAFSGGILMGVAVFWIAPDLAAFFGWGAAAAWMGVGFAALWITNRYVHPVCPSCSHTHDHDQCSTRLHGFAGPMLIAASVHSFLDGWVLAAGNGESMPGLAMGIILGIAAHKLPEGLALGIIVRASLGSVRPAIVSLIGVQLLTVAGAGAAVLLAPWLGMQWAHVLLALAAGSFLFLGYHAIHSEYKRGGAVPAFMPALTGVAGSSVVRIFGGRLFNL
jgi:zinc transporter ZupT